ncbi:MAG: phosphoglycerate dehydrogenase, partial [Candidatus Latescibacterota bacterium]
MKVLISDPVDQQCVRHLEKEGLEVDVRTHLSPEELKQVIGQYSALIVRSGTKVTADLIQAAQNMKVIGRAGSGVDNIDVAAATKQGIVVMNTPGGNTIS